MEFNTDRNTEEVENIAAAENDVAQRLDIYLAAKLEVSRSNMQKLLEEGRVFRGAKVFKANYKVKVGDVFTVMLPEPELLDIRSEAIHLDVIFDDEDSKHALVVVPDNKLSLAIGRRGQNVRLAAHLTGYRIDIKSASEFEEMEAAQETFEDQVESGEEQVD